MWCEWWDEGECRAIRGTGVGNERVADIVYSDAYAGWWGTRQSVVIWANVEWSISDLYTEEKGRYVCTTSNYEDIAIVRARVLCLYYRRVDEIDSVVQDHSILRKEGEEGVGLMSVAEWKFYLRADQNQTRESTLTLRRDSTGTPSFTKTSPHTYFIMLSEELRIGNYCFPNHSIYGRLATGGSDLGRRAITFYTVKVWVCRAHFIKIFLSEHFRCSSSFAISHLVLLSCLIFLMRCVMLHYHTTTDYAIFLHMLSELSN